MSARAQAGDNAARCGDAWVCGTQGAPETSGVDHPEPVDLVLQAANEHEYAQLVRSRLQIGARAGLMY